MSDTNYFWIWSFFISSMFDKIFYTFSLLTRGIELWASIPFKSSDCLACWSEFEQLMEWLLSELFIFCRILVDYDYCLSLKSSFNMFSWGPPDYWWANGLYVPLKLAPDFIDWLNWSMVIWLFIALNPAFDTFVCSFSFLAYVWRSWDKFWSITELVPKLDFEGKCWRLTMSF